MQTSMQESKTSDQSEMSEDSSAHQVIHFEIVMRLKYNLKRSEEQARRKKKEAKGLTEEKLEENINIAFGETSTMTLFFMYILVGEGMFNFFPYRPSATATQENPDFADYQNKNKDYERV